MIPDSELLRQYARQGDEDAFAEVVRRQVNFVYSTALRVTAGDSHLAQDVAQKVFAKLAVHAGQLCGRESVIGWLHVTTRNTAIKAIRTEQRRRIREQEAAMLHEQNSPAEATWESLGPVLDHAMAELSEDDREVLLLRYFTDKSYRDMGTELGLNENAARMRLQRALDKLRGYFQRQGMTVSSGALAVALDAHSLQAAPTQWAQTVAEASLTEASAVGFGGAWLAAIFMSTKIKIVAAVAVAAVIALTFVATRPGAPAQAPAPRAAIPPATSTTPAPPNAALQSMTPPAALPVAAGRAAENAAAAATPLRPENPQKELKTTITDVVRILRTQDFTKLWETYMPPEMFAAMSPEEREQMAEGLKRQNESAGGRQAMAEMIAGLESIKDTAPRYNAAGDRAVYEYSYRGGMKPITFVRIDGLWYILDN